MGCLCHRLPPHKERTQGTKPKDQQGEHGQRMRDRALDVRPESGPRGEASVRRRSPSPRVVVRDGR